MLEKPNMFQAYLAQSPYLDKAIGDPIVERMTKFLQANPKLDSFYYMNLGSEPNLEKNFSEMKKLLETKAPKSFRVYAESDSGKCLLFLFSFPGSRRYN